MRHALVAIVTLAAISSQGQVHVGRLTCEGLVEPLGIDVQRPRLSWQIYSEQRGQRQTAYRIIAASDPSLLQTGKPDLWDSGKIYSDRSIFVRYAGRPLASSQKVFWQVMVWDKYDKPSAWSQTSCWTMGLLSAGDWKGAEWITDKLLLEKVRRFFGYRSIETTDPGKTKWIQVDLGQDCVIEAVRLHPILYGATERIGMPVRFKVESDDEPTMADAQVIADFTDRDYPNPWASVVELQPKDRVVGRFVRLTATRLRLTEGTACLALSQLEVISGGRNVAIGALVTASDGIERGPWSISSIVDGKIPGPDDPLGNPTLLFRKDFSVRPGLKRALVHICGLGQYHLSVNGSRIGKAFLRPGWTAYDKTCLYDTYDLTDTLEIGQNTIGLIVAGGMYNCQAGRYVKFVGPYRPLTIKGIVRLEYEDGTVDELVTDGSWQVHQGPITFCNVYGGEDYDARLAQIGWDKPGFDAKAWRHVVVFGGPGGDLRGATYGSPAFSGREVISPVAVKEIRPGVEVYDLGQNASITIRMKVHGPAGSQIRVTPAELIKPDGTVDRGSCGGGRAYWSYTLAGGAPEQWAASFFYHGARYLQVERLPSDDPDRLPQLDSIEAQVVHADCASIGELASSSELFNRIRQLVRWAQRSNLASVITDCPHRERLGWLEQYHLNGPALRYEWDMTQLYRKCFQDMADAQLPNGLVPDTAPEYVIFPDGFRDSPEWGSAVILAAWQHYLFTGDDGPLSENYQVLRRYLDYLEGRCKDGILSHGLGDWYDLGPGRPGISQLTPMGLTATAIYYQDLCTMAKVAQVLGLRDEAAAYSRQAEQVKVAFNSRFFDQERGLYGTGSQTAQAMPLALGLVEQGYKEKVLEALIKDVQAKGFTAGDIGYRYVLRALADGGRSDLVVQVCNRMDRPGYAYQLKQGATSLTEAWDADRRASQNHFMLGQIVEWFYHDLAGIRPDPCYPGFKRFTIRPAILDGIDWVRASYHCPYGLIASEWSRLQDGGLRLRLTIPVNTIARLELAVNKDSSITESGQPIDKAEGIRLASGPDGHAVYTLESGIYDLVVGP